MGFQFNLEAANIVANLTFKRIDSCMQDICSSEKAREGFYEFLNNFTNNFFSSRDLNISKNIEEAKERFRLFHHYNPSLDYQNYNDPCYLKAKESLEWMAGIFDLCPVKILLLPSINRNHSNDYMV